jgi:hypothetical protein
MDEPRRTATTRANGAVLYALTAIVLAAGAVWWFSSAPAAYVDPQMAAWRSAVERGVPDRSDQIDAQTNIIGPDQSGSANGDTSPGPYRLVLVCAGRGQVRVRMSTSGDDSGRAVTCSDTPVPAELSVGLAEQYFVSYEAEVPQRVAFRWQLYPA